MASRRKKMTDPDLASAVSIQIDEAKAYDRSDRAEHRDWALRFMEGEVDLPPMGKNRSKVVSRDVADIHGMILPGLMRVFFSTDRIVIYEPTRDVHEEYSDQASDLVNYVVMRECDGYRNFRAAFSDGLLLGNGILKHWWDGTPEYTTEDYSGLSDDQLQALLADPDVEEVTEQEDYPDPEYQPPTPEQIQQIAAQRGINLQGVDPAVLEAIIPPPPMLHDLTIKRIKSTGRLKIAALPPEEFLLERAATILDETCRFCAHVQRRTRSDLVKDGYDKDKVAAIPAYQTTTDQAARNARDKSAWLPDRSADAATEYVEIHECYILVDQDGDGIAERRRVVMGGISGERSILTNEEWGDDLPFSDIIPEPVPHRWRGHGLYEEVGDIQRIKTVFLRGVTDNTYKVLNPQYDAEEGSVLNPDELINPTFGGVRWIKAGKQPPKPVEENPIAQAVMPVIDYMDGVAERRTGISQRSQALDMDALQNQSATAVNAAQSAAYTKIEEYARNIAECGGMRRIFACILRLIVKHQDRGKVIRLRGKLVTINPDGWDPNMDVTIDTGLGTGSKERDLAILSGIAAKQEGIIQQGGPFNDICDIGHLMDTYQKMAEAGGVRNPESFFPTIPPEYIAQQKALLKNQPPKPDPKLEIEQLKANTAMQIQQSEFQSNQARAQAEIHKSQAEAQVKIIQAQAAAREAEMAQQLAAAQIQVDRLKAAAANQTTLDKAAMDNAVKLAIAQIMASKDTDQNANALARQVDQQAGIIPQ